LDGELLQVRLHNLMFLQKRRDYLYIAIELIAANIMAGSGNVDDLALQP
jgi:hypothetical protein